MGRLTDQTDLDPKKGPGLIWPTLCFDYLRPMAEQGGVVPHILRACFACVLAATAAAVSVLLSPLMLQLSAAVPHQNYQSISNDTVIDDPDGSHSYSVAYLPAAKSSCLSLVSRLSWVFYTLTPRGTEGIYIHTSVM